MKLRHPGLIGLLAFLLSWLIRFWTRTLHFRMVFLDGKKHPTDARRDRHIYAFWHEALLFPTAFETRVNILISQHADGELIARLCRHLGAGVVRGSTTRGGIAGLMGMVHKSGAAHLAITPDGPRGPRRRLQMGVVLLASLTGLPVVPLGLTFTPAWRACSWDRMLLPKPWGAAYGVVGIPIFVGADLNRQELERFRLRVEEEMARLTEAAERWAREGIPPRPVKLERLRVRMPEEMEIRKERGARSEEIGEGHLCSPLSPHL
jgi:lysophospholipid acyltransferase (LPLAT)-like uncharacterized protein